MNIVNELQQRSDSTCELCSVANDLDTYVVPPKKGELAEDCAYLCETCITQIEGTDQMVSNHWRCLNDSMWNTNPAVQVLAWRMLTRLRSEGWPQDLLDMLYLDEDILAWAKAIEEDTEEDDKIIHKDSNGAVLEAGDSVVLIKDLNVKGANFTAKRGTAVRNITLTHDNPEHIEGKVNGQHIVILTKFVKK